MWLNCMSETTCKQTILGDFEKDERAPVVLTFDGLVSESIAPHARRSNCFPATCLVEAFECLSPPTLGTRNFDSPYLNNQLVEF